MGSDAPIRDPNFSQLHQSLTFYGCLKFSFPMTVMVTNNSNRHKDFVGININICTTESCVIAVSTDISNFVKI